MWDALAVSSRTRRWILASLVVLAGLLVSPRTWACSCWEEDVSVAEAFADAQAVFVGTVVATKPRNIDPNDPPLFKMSTDFEVTQMFKGDIEVGDRVRVFTPGSYWVGECGRSYGSVGDEWLVYASRPSRRLVDGFCSRSRDERMDGDLQILASLVDDSPPPTLRRRGCAIEQDQLGGGAILLVILFAAAATSSRRKS
jgi:hypothetical protein